MRFYIQLFIIAMLSIGASAAEKKSVKVTPLAQFNKYQGTDYSSVWGYTDPNGREYAILGVRTGTSIIDITDAPELKEIAFIPGANSIWRELKTYKHYAYVVNETGEGMQIIDLSDLPRSAKIANVYTGFQTAHTVSVDAEAGILFAEGDHAEPVRVMSLADPENPVQISFLGVECHDMYARNGTLYVSEGGHGSIGIFDYSNPREPTLIKRFGIRRAGYVHNSWLTEDGRYLMTTEETEGKSVKMFALNDLKNIRQVSEYLAPNGLAHNTHIRGNYAFIAHYGAGLRVVDVSNPNVPKEVAYYSPDTPPPGFVGAWGAFPYFPSGKVLISSIEEGLFVFADPTR